MKIGNLLMVFICLLGLSASGNPNSTLATLDAWFDDFDYGKLKTNYFFNRGFISDVRLQQWKDQQTITTTPAIWRYIASGLSRSEVTPDPNTPIPKTQLTEQGEDRTVLHICGYAGDVLSAPNLNAPTEMMDIFAAIGSDQVVYSKTVNFQTSPDHFYSNWLQIGEIEVDWADGNGWQLIDPSEVQSHIVQYSHFGEKRIALKRILGSDTLHAVFNISVKPLPHSNFYVSDSSTHKTESPYDAYGIRTAHFPNQMGTAVQRPLIISTGFDLLGNHGLEWQISKYSELIDQFVHGGMDVYVVVYTFPEQSVWDNAQRLKRLIQKINLTREEQYGGVLMGASMGGVISRIALKQMEDAGIDHQIDTYLSIDAPHSGANIPIGLQTFLTDVYELIPEMLIYGTELVDIYETTFDTNVPYLDFFSTFQSVGAKELIRHHVGDEYLRIWGASRDSTTFEKHYARLQQLGWPEQCKNIGILNGSMKGRPQWTPFTESAMGPGAEMIDYNRKGFPVDIKCQIWHGSSLEEKIVSKLYVYSNISTESMDPTVEAIGKWRFPMTIYDGLSGGFEPELQHLSDLTKNLRFCFIPSLSAAGIPLELFEENPDANYKNLFEQTPFDQLYGNPSNTFHVDLEAIEMKELLASIIAQEVVPRSLFFDHENLPNSGAYIAPDQIRIESNAGPIVNLARNSDYLFTSSRVSINPNVKIAFGSHTRIIAEESRSSQKMGWPETYQAGIKVNAYPKMETQGKIDHTEWEWSSSNTNHSTSHRHNNQHAAQNGILFLKSDSGEMIDWMIADVPVNHTPAPSSRPSMEASTPLLYDLTGKIVPKTTTPSTGYYIETPTSGESKLIFIH